MSLGCLSFFKTPESCLAWQNSFLSLSSCEFSFFISKQDCFLSFLYRVDKSGKYYTGVLCGLGWSQTSGAPLFPENNMELTFDVHFGVEDISEVKHA